MEEDYLYYWLLANMQDDFVLVRDCWLALYWHILINTYYTDKFGIINATTIRQRMNHWAVFDYIPTIITCSLFCLEKAYWLSKQTNVMKANPHPRSWRFYLRSSSSLLIRNQSKRNVLPGIDLRPATHIYFY